ncbi:MAG: SRPBCC domain-containing protein [bacterium]|nr:SRPBCC domain-containing protein [bacterium]
MKRFISLCITLGLIAGAAAQAKEKRSMANSIDTSLFVAAGGELRSFVKEVVVDAPAAEVFAAWATDEGWARVYGAPSDSRIDLAVGGRYEWLFDGEVGSNECQVLSYIPDRMISFSWSAPPTQPTNRDLRTWVVVECEPSGDGATRLRLTHLGFGEGAEWNETYDYFDAAWGRVLAQMQEKLGIGGR